MHRRLHVVKCDARSLTLKYKLGAMCALQKTAANQRVSRSFSLTRMKRLLLSYFARRIRASRIPLSRSFARGGEKRETIHLNTVHSWHSLSFSANFQGGSTSLDATYSNHRVLHFTPSSRPDHSPEQTISPFLDRL